MYLFTRLILKGHQERTISSAWQVNEDKPFILFFSFCLSFTGIPFSSWGNYVGQIQRFACVIIMETGLYFLVAIFKLLKKDVLLFL